MKKKFKDKTKFLFLKYSVIPILFVIIIFSLFVIVMLHYKIVLDANHSAKNIENKFTKVYEDYTEEIEEMAQSSQTKKVLKEHKDINLAYEKFYNFNLKQDVKSAFYLVDTDLIILAETNQLNDEGQNALLHKFVPRIEDKPEELIVEVGMTNYSHEQNSSITMGKAVTDDEGKVLGYIIYKLYVSDLQQLIFGEKSEIAIITDRYDHIVVSTNDIVQGLMNKFLPEKISQSRVKINDITYYMKENKIANIPFKVFALNKNKAEFFTLTLFGIFILLLFITVYFLINSVAEKMSTQNSESIDKLLLAISKLEDGKLNSFVEINTGDEFELLAKHYNKMLVNLNQVININKELSDIKRINEMKLLQSQFNPHFLFNILEMLRYTILSDVEKSEEIILSLSNLLRYSAKETKENVELQEDMLYIRDYLKLHKLRFDDRLKYKIEIQDEANEAKIPKLLLQPMIENAIKYGYETQLNLDIYIQIKIKNNNLVAKIMDNGKGIASDKLKTVKDNLNSNSNKMIGTGLYNTHRKLRLKYGPDYGLSIESQENQGTTIFITIPYIKGE